MKDKEERQSRKTKLCMLDLDRKNYGRELDKQGKKYKKI